MDSICSNTHSIIESWRRNWNHWYRMEGPQISCSLLGTQSYLLSFTDNSISSLTPFQYPFPQESILSIVSLLYPLFRVTSHGNILALVLRAKGRCDGNLSSYLAQFYRCWCHRTKLPPVPRHFSPCPAKSSPLCLCGLWSVRGAEAFILLVPVCVAEKQSLSVLEWWLPSQDPTLMCSVFTPLGHWLGQFNAK